MRNKTMLIVVPLFVMGMNLVVLHAEQLPSTNPCRPWVDKFPLPNYDTALDSIDYSQSYLKIKWPWENDPERLEKHERAVLALSEVYPLHVGITGGIHSHQGKEKMELFLFTIAVDEPYVSEEDLIFPIKLTDEMLAKTLPYIPEIKYISIQQTSITDAGLKNIYYLPRLESVRIYEQEKITDIGLKLICCHPAMQKVEIIDMPITEAMLDVFGEYGNRLNWLQFRNIPLPATEFLFIPKMQQLRDLYLSMSNKTDAETLQILSKNIFQKVASLEQLTSLSLDGFDFSEKPSSEQLRSIQILQKRGKLVYLTMDSPIHPLLLRQICEIKSLRVLSLSKGIVEFTPEHPICYERVMYEYANYSTLVGWSEDGKNIVKKINVVPEYYQKLEKEFEEELKWHTWADKKGKTVKAKLVKIGKKKVSLEKEDGAEITISRTSLNQDDQLYLKELERLKEDKKNDAEKGK